MRAASNQNQQCGCSRARLLGRPWVAGVLAVSASFLMLYGLRKLDERKGKVE